MTAQLAAVPVARSKLLMPDYLRDKLGFLESDAENRKAFFSRIAGIYPSMDPRYVLVERAYTAAKNAFRKEVREDGVRYFEHLRAVALIAIDYLFVRDADLICALILHDIVEDIGDWSIERVEREFNKQVALYVWWLSKPEAREKEGKADLARRYFRQLHEAPRGAILAKMCDRLHNLMNLWSCEKEKVCRKVEETRNFIIPLAQQHQLLAHELEDVLRMLEAKYCT